MTAKSQINSAFLFDITTTLLLILFRVFLQIAYFTGCSGHAFHCAPALGKTLAELVYEGKTAIDISRFSAKRFLLS